MALLIEMVVDRRVDCSELLETLHPSKAEHGAFSSSKRQMGILKPIIYSAGAVRQMRTRIGLLVQPEPMRSIIDATQR